MLAEWDGRGGGVFFTEFPPRPPFPKTEPMAKTQSAPKAKKPAATKSPDLARVEMIADFARRPRPNNRDTLKRIEGLANEILEGVKTLPE